MTRLEALRELEGAIERTSNLALLRMRKAHKAGRGVRLSYEELNAFYVQALGDWWDAIEDDGTNTRSSVEEAKAND